MKDKLWVELVKLEMVGAPHIEWEYLKVEVTVVCSDKVRSKSNCWVSAALSTLVNVGGVWVESHSITS